MIRFDDYPYAQFREAFGTVLGRVGLVVMAALGGSMLGGLTATRSIEGLWLGVIGLPVLSLASIFYGVGLFVLPALPLYAFASVRCEWPLRLDIALCPPHVVEHPQDHSLDSLRQPNGEAAAEVSGRLGEGVRKRRWIKQTRRTGSRSPMNNQEDEE